MFVLIQSSRVKIIPKVCHQSQHINFNNMQSLSSVAFLVAYFSSLQEGFLDYPDRTVTEATEKKIQKGHHVRTQQLNMLSKFKDEAHCSLSFSSSSSGPRVPGGTRGFRTGSPLLPVLRLLSSCFEREDTL